MVWHSRSRLIVRSSFISESQAIRNYCYHPSDNPRSHPTTETRLGMCATYLALISLFSFALFIFLSFSLYLTFLSLARSLSFSSDLSLSRFFSVSRSFSDVFSHALVLAFSLPLSLSPAHSLGLRLR